MKKYLIITVATLLHVALTLLFLLGSVGYMMQSFDGEGTNLLLISFFAIGSIILTLPLFLPFSSLPAILNFDPGWLGYVPLVINSLIWVLGIQWLYRRVKKRPIMKSSS